MENIQIHEKACKKDLPIEYLLFAICLTKDNTQTERNSLPKEPTV